uniref:glutamine amidotransferase-related protein n=1 Tax=Gallaecimonas mangrovi TaxID=2291597 RepID=UPI000E1FD00B|nr:amidotransferase [Gallaecimonas mangrovi]
MKIALLQTDVLHPEFIEQYQSFGVMFQQMFAAADIEIQSEIFSVIDGVYPPNPDDFDAMLVTGSKADAFSNEPWVLTLGAYLRQRHDAGQKLLGICFGHQLLAHALGGRTERAAAGWGVGVMAYQWQTKPTWLNDEAATFKLICSHRDQVTQLPPGATLLAANDFCPNAAFYIADKVLAFQGHPEFSTDFGAELIHKRQLDIGDPLAQKALTSYAQGHDGLAIAKVMRDFVGH